MQTPRVELDRLTGMVIIYDEQGTKFLACDQKDTLVLTGWRQVFMSMANGGTLPAPETRAACRQCADALGSIVARCSFV